MKEDIKKEEMVGGCSGFVPLLLLFLLLTPLTLRAQTATFAIVEWKVVNTDTSDPEKIKEGKTEVSDVMRRLNLSEREEFSSREEMEKYLDDMRQDLVDAKSFKEVSWTLQEGGTVNNIREVSVTWNLIPTGTFFPLPYPQIDSNSGYGAGFLFDWTNVGGNLFDIYFDANASWQTQDYYEEPSKTYLSRVEGVLQVKNIRYKETYWDTELRYRYREETEREGVNNAVVSDYFYNYVLASVDFRYFLSEEWVYRAKLFPTFYFGYKDEREVKTGIKSTGDKESVTIPIRNEFQWGDISRQGNFHFGDWLTLSNVLEYRRSFDQDDKLSNAVSLEWLAEWGQLFAQKSIAYGYEVKFISSQEKNLTDMGFYLRGVPNNFLSGNIGLFLNTSFYFNLIPVKGLFTVVMAPFVDVGFFTTVGGVFSADQVHLGTGSEFTLYVDSIENLELTVAVGVDALAMGRGTTFGNALEFDLSVSYFFEKEKED